jgi:hypothetical protein
VEGLNRRKCRTRTGRALRPPSGPRRYLPGDWAEHLLSAARAHAPRPELAASQQAPAAGRPPDQRGGSRRRAVGGLGARGRFIAPAATRSALLLRLAAGPEQMLGFGSRRWLACPVVYLVEVDRLGRCFHALVTGGAAGGLAIRRLDRRVTCRRCRADEMVGRWGSAGATVHRGLSSCRLSKLQLDATVRD